MSEMSVLIKKKGVAMKNSTIYVGISSCLLGEQVRFDGGHKKDSFITNELTRYFQFVPYCPETGIGMSVPRPTIRLEEREEKVRLIEPKSGRDFTDEMVEYAKRTIKKLKEMKISGYILKKDSPSCGMERVRKYHENGIPTRDGIGIYARELMKLMPLLPVEEEGRLKDAKLRENFILRVFAFHDIQHFLSQHPTPGKLVEFHTRYKLIFMAHSPEVYRKLGRLVARAGAAEPFHLLLNGYLELFMKGLAVRATPKKHSNVMYHLLGFFRDQLTQSEKSELIQLIEHYRDGLVPLIVPLTLIKHHLSRFEHNWLKVQKYFQPYPFDLKLQNVV